MHTQMVHAHDKFQWTLHYFAFISADGIIHTKNLVNNSNCIVSVCVCVCGADTLSWLIGWHRSVCDRHARGIWMDGKRWIYFCCGHEQHHNMYVHKLFSAFEKRLIESRIKWTMGKSKIYNRLTNCNWNVNFCFFHIYIWRHNENNSIFRSVQLILPEFK